MTAPLRAILPLYRPFSRMLGLETALPHPGENVEVEEVHGPEDHEDEADLRARELDRFRQRVRLVPVLEGERDVSNVDEVEADHEEAVHRVGERLVVPERIHEEYATALEEGSRDPDRDSHAEDQIHEIRVDDVHVRLLPYGLFNVLNRYPNRTGSRQCNCRRRVSIPHEPSGFVDINGELRRESRS